MITFDSVLCTYEPAAIQPNWSDYGLAVNRFTTFLGRNHTTVNVDATNKYSCVRVVSYTLTWDAQDAPLDAAMYNKLMMLYTTQKSFVCRIDDPLARDYGRCVKIEDGVYATPTHPIKPHNWVEGVGGSWQVEDVIVGGEYWTGTIAIDEESGIITLTDPSISLTDSTQVHIRYKFVGNFKVVQIMMSPNDLAQEYYSGTVVIESV